MVEYTKKFKLIKELKPFVLVTGGGRSGTDFLQSLLDSHEEVISFNGHLKLYKNFFLESKCLNSRSYDLRDLAHEFIGLYIEKFNSKYDFLERKDQLGLDGEDNIKIEPQKFVESFLSLLNGEKLSKKNILLAIHAAYHESSGNKFEKLKIFLYHAHHFDEAYEFKTDFSNATIICTTRDPRAGLVSTIENWKKFDELDESKNNFHHDSYLFYYFHLKRITEDEGRLVFSGMNHYIVKLENLLNQKFMKNFSKFLSIKFNETMLSPTFGGKIWYGDRISGEKIRKLEWSEKRTYNGWKEKLSWREQYIISFIMHSKLKRNDYELIPLTFFGFFLVITLAFVPFKYELRYLSMNYITSVFKKNRLRCLYYLFFTPINFFKVRILLLKYAIIQFTNKLFPKKFKFLP